MTPEHSKKCREIQPMLSGTDSSGCHADCPVGLLAGLPEPIRETIQQQLSAAERSKEAIRQEQHKERVKRWLAFTAEVRAHMPPCVDVIPREIPEGFTSDQDRWYVEVHLPGLPMLILHLWRDGDLGDWHPEPWQVRDECSRRDIASGLTWEAALLLAYQHACRRLTDPTPF